MVRISVVALAATLIFACGSTGPDEVGTGATDGGRAPTSRLSSSEILAAAARAATTSGEEEPTDIAWVRTTRRQAGALISGSVVAGPEDDVPVVLVQLRGHFTADQVQRPPGGDGERGDGPSGTVMSLALDEVTGRVLDFGLTDTVVDLSTLGPVEP